MDISWRHSSSTIWPRTVNCTIQHALSIWRELYQVSQLPICALTRERIEPIAGVLCAPLVNNRLNWTVTINEYKIEGISRWKSDHMRHKGTRKIGCQKTEVFKKTFFLGRHYALGKKTSKSLNLLRLQQCRRPSVLSVPFLSFMWPLSPDMPSNPYLWLLFDSFKIVSMGNTTAQGMWRKLFAKFRPILCVPHSVSNSDHLVGLQLSPLSFPPSSALWILSPTINEKRYFLHLHWPISRRNPVRAILFCCLTAALLHFLQRPFWPLPSLFGCI